MTALGLALLAGCTNLDALNALSAKPSVTPQTVDYGDLPRQKIDIYVPAPNAPATNMVASARAAGDAMLRPIVIFFYGGSWTYGSRQDYAFVAKAFLDEGFVVAIPDYRLSPEVVYPVFLQDSAAAVKKVIEKAREFGGDPSRVVLMGHSAGAYNAAMVALDKRLLSDTDRRAICGVVGLATPLNFLPIQLPAARVAFSWPNTPPDSQPIAHVSADSPPMLLITARHDPLVDPEINTRAMAQKLAAAGVSVQVETIDGPLGLIGHASLVATLSSRFSFLAPTLARTKDFLEQVTAR